MILRVLTTMGRRHSHDISERLEKALVQTLRADKMDGCRES
jgi:hypothetical protein